MQPNFLAQTNRQRPFAVGFLLFTLAVVIGVIVFPGTKQETAIGNFSSDRFGTAEAVFRIAAPEIDESSGLIPSVRYEGCFWTHNDGGAKKGLFLIDSDGKHLATVQIKKADERDWESIANVRRDDRHLIAVGDIGDNLAENKSCKIYLIDEPVLELDEKSDEPVKESVPLVQEITFRYPDGPQDCEAMAYDVASDRLWFVSKQRLGGPRASNAGGKNGTLAETAIHFLELPSGETESTSTKTATRIESRFKELYVTDMNIAPDNRVAVIRTPLQAFVFDRAENQSWQDVFAGSPTASTVLPYQRQGESVCFSRDGSSLWFTSEGVNQPVWRIPIFQPTH